MIKTVIKMSIMTQLEFELDFSYSEKEIARYILNHGEDVLSMSAKQLANATYTSPATIVRLCRKLGLDGYNDFKIKYSAELQYDQRTKKRIDVNFPFSVDDDEHGIAENLLLLTNEVISDTYQLINYDELNQFVDLLYHNQNIDIYGSGNSILAALSFQHKMMRIQRNVNVKTIQGEQIFMSYNSSPDKIALMISYSGETSDLVRYAKILKEKQTPILLITSLGDNQLSRMADHVLHLDSREKIFNKIAPFSSQISMEYVLNLIFSCIFLKDYNENIQNKISYDKKNDDRHPLISPINED